MSNERFWAKVGKDHFVTAERMAERQFTLTEWDNYTVTVLHQINGKKVWQHNLNPSFSEVKWWLYALLNNRVSDRMICVSNVSTNEEIYSYEWYGRVIIETNND